MPKKPGKSAAKKRGPAKPRSKTGSKEVSTAKPAAKLSDVAPGKLPSIRQLVKKSALVVWEHKRLFGGITLIYGVLNFILVQGLSGAANVAQLKESLQQVFTGHFASLASGLGTFTSLLSSAGNTTGDTASAYQAFLVVIASLAVIWALRQILSGNRPGIRDAYYRGMSPLVPFMLVLFVISLQLVPLVLGSTLYALVINNGIAVYAVEKIIWAVVAGVLALLTFYMLSSSIFALYIVTLPDMTPLQALRSARRLVRHRRWTVLRKMLCLPIILLVAAAIIMIPIIIVLTPLAAAAFFILTMLSLLAIHTYTYTLYRELLNE